MNDEEKTKEQLIQELAYLHLLIAEMEDKYRQSEDILRVITAQYQHITKAMSDYIFSVHIVDGNPVKTVHGPTCKIITGYSPEEFSINPWLWIQMVHEEDRAAVVKYVEEIVSGHSVKPLEHRIVRKDGTIRWVRNTPACQYDETGKLIAYDGLIQDITERKIAEEALRRSEEKYRIVADFTYDWEYWLGSDGHYIYVSPSCERITGYSPGQFLADPDLLAKITHPDDYEMIIKHSNDVFERSNEVCNMDFRIIVRSGGERWISHICQSIYSEDGKWLGRRGNNRDISKRKQLEEEMRALTLCDELTGLFNRRGFMTFGEQQMRIANRIKNRLVLIFADIDGMKWINDTFGHHEGDAALKEITNILKKTFRESDIIARIGGDEFVILAIETDESNDTLLIERLKKHLDEYNEKRERSYGLMLSIGIAHYDPEHPSSLVELMEQADALMYMQKREKHGK